MKKLKINKSIQKSLVISFVIAILITIVLLVLEFFIFVEPSISNKIIEINIRSKEDAETILYAIRRGMGFAIFDIILISIVLIRINLKKMLRSN